MHLTQQNILEHGESTMTIDSELYQLIKSLPMPLKEEMRELIKHLIVISERQADGQGLPRLRQFGSAQGLIHVSEDFDAPIEDFSAYTSDAPSLTQRLFGSAQGLVLMSGDFDDPLDEFEAYMQNTELNRPDNSAHIGR